MSAAIALQQEKCAEELKNSPTFAGLAESTARSIEILRVFRGAHLYYVNCFMNKILYFFYVLILCFCTTTQAMEPDEQSLRDPKFVSEYNCSTEHFLLRKYFENEQWDQAILVIEKLEKNGFADRYLTASKAKVFMMKRNYNKALLSFQKALGESYKCKLTIPKFKFTSHPDFAREAILWHYISQIYELMKEEKNAATAQNKSEKLLLRSLDLNPKEAFRYKENANITLIKIYSLYNLFEKPISP